MNPLRLLYLRWSVVLVAVMGLAALTAQHYRDHLAGFVPQEVTREAPAGDIRVAGMVQRGTVTGNARAGHAAFQLMGREASLPVVYEGPPQDNLRAFKTLVVIGAWDASAGVFRAREIGIVPNYGFVAGAYLVGLLPLALLVFAMSRRVNLLYEDMKTSALYQED